MVRRRRVFVIAIALIPALLLAFGYWLAVSEAGLRLLAAGVVALGGGRVEIVGAHGALVGPLRIERLRVDMPDQRVEIGELALDWTPRHLPRLLEIPSLRMAMLSVMPTRKSEASLPESLRLPLALALPDIHIGELRWGDAIDLRGVQLSLHKPADRYRLEVLGLDSDWGAASARFNLSESAPFALDGEANLRSRQGQDARLTLAGELALIFIKAQAAAPMRLDAEAEWAHFEKIPLRRARLELSDFDPAAWRVDLPRARFSAEAEFVGEDDGRVRGHLRIANALPGPLDGGRLPVAAARMRLVGGVDDLRLDEVLLDLGYGGSLRGEGHYRAGALRLELRTDDLDPHALHGRLRAMRVAGAISLDGDEATQRLQADLVAGQYGLALDVTRRGAALEIARARLAAGHAAFTASGNLELEAPHRFDLRGGLDAFDPAAFGDFPSAMVNARLDASGHLMPGPVGLLDFRLERSRWRDLALSGGGRLRLSPERIDEADVNLALGGNRLRIEGAFGRPADRLDWLLRADDLGALAADLRGTLRASGQLRGGVAAPAGQFTIVASDLRWGDALRLAGLNAHGRLDEGARGPLTMRLDAEDLKLGGFDASRLEVDMRGRRDAHEISAGVRGVNYAALARLAGGWDGEAWSGELREFANAGRHAFSLRRPAKLRGARARIELGQATLDYAGARIDLRETTWSPEAWRSRGEFSGLEVARLAALPASQPQALARWRGDLKLAGSWNVTLGAQVDGEVMIARESGDLIAPGSPPLPLALQTLRLELRARADRLRGELRARGAELGGVEAWLDTTLSRRDGAHGLAGNAPLSGRAEAELRSLAWLGPLLGSGIWSLDGAARAQVDLTGTPSAPRFDGILEGSGLRLDWPEEGVHLDRGELRATLNGDRLRLEHLRLRGGDGELLARGEAAWRDGAPDLDLTISARNLRALSRPDRLLVVSGETRLDTRDDSVRLRGSLRADRARILLPRADAPTRSSDVVVLGREAPARAAPLRFDLDLNLDLGERFLIQGRGLDARLAGALRVSAPPGAYPRLLGGVRVAEGAYAAYGQRLVIERGLLDFQGPIDNPGLDILAMRLHQPVEAGIAITGTVLSPRARLVSRPEVPDGEKLSWLVLGRGMDAAGGGDFDLLATAAGALLSAGDSVSLQARVAQATGLDEVALRGGGELESTVLTLGKRLSSRAYLSFEQGVTGLGTLVKLNYTLTRNWSVQAQTGGESAVDLFYTLSFD